MARDPSIEALLDYPNSPKRVRLFWRSIGLILTLGSIAAALWFGIVLLVGAYWTIRYALDMSFWGTVGGALVVWLYAKLKHRFPWEYR